MAVFSSHLENALLKHILGIAQYSPPTNLKLGLSTTTPLENGSGITEPTGNYARTTITFDSSSNGIISNNSIINFPQATSNWGTIKYTFIADQNNNLLCFSAITSQNIESGDVVTFPTGSIQVQFDLSFMSSYLANALLNMVFKGISYSQPDLYLALSTQEIVTAITEPNISAGYSRFHLSSNDFTVTDGIATSERSFLFGPASDDWGKVYGCAIMDDEDGGNILLYFNFDEYVDAVLGTSIVFDEGDFIITLD